MITNRSSYSLGAALGSALVLTLCAPAMAADIYDGGLKGGYEVPPPPENRGIYLKGYIGQANPDVGNMWNEVYDSGNFSVLHNDIKSTPLYGFGVGWQARHWLRFDGTIEYRGDALFLGQDLDVPTPGTNEYTADIKSWLGLVNAYIDMGNWCGFTPYIGAGIGFATISVEGLRDDGASYAVLPNAPSIAYGADKTKTNFAYAFYAGTSFDVTPQVALDLTYRWAHLGDAQSGAVYTYDGNYAYAGQHIRDITSNDVMLGVRYKFQREAVAYQPVK